MQKKWLYSSLCLALGALSFTSCSSDSDGDGDKTSAKDTFEQNYFTVENASFNEGSMPSATGDETLDITANPQALSGGLNFITIESDEALSDIYVGVSGTSGYFTIPASSVANRAGNVYSVAVEYGTAFNADMTMQIGGRTASGHTCTPAKFDVEYVESLSGAIDINLTFSNAKDIDLHLYTPSGKHIYYADRGGDVELDNGEIISYGLDHDSNASCHIDNLNNENIYIPAELVEAGVYTVQVDMWENCDRTIATDWTIIARYQGNRIRPIEGTNPARGTYEVGAGSGDHTTVMKFEITNSMIAQARSSRIMNVKLYEPTESAKAKMIEDEFRQAGL